MHAYYYDHIMDAMDSLLYFVILNYCDLIILQLNWKVDTEIEHNETTADYRLGHAINRTL